MAKEKFERSKPLSLIHILAEVLKTSSEKFIAGMDDDFNTAKGLGAIFELVKELNKALDLSLIHISNSWC